MRFLVIMTLVLAAPQLAAAQVAATGVVTKPAIEIPAAGVTQELLLNDGTRVIGHVESVGDTQFTFRADSGLELTLEKMSVQSLRAFTGRIVNGELWESDPNTTRLFFGPTGRALKRGEAYLGVYEVFMPFVQVGVTDRISVGAGTVPLFGDVAHPFWLTPKLQIVRRARNSASIGAIHFFNAHGFFDTDNDGGAGIAYGVVTHGDDDASVTIGGGYAYSTGERRIRDAYSPYPDYDEKDSHGAPVLMIGGEYRTSRRVKLVTENYAFKSGGIASIGARFFGDKLSADLAFAIPLSGDYFYLFPMVNIVRKF
jgi:hypothetical protein